MIKDFNIGRYLSGPKEITWVLIRERGRWEGQKRDVIMGAESERELKMKHCWLEDGGRRNKQKNVGSF